MYLIIRLVINILTEEERELLSREYDFEDYNEIGRFLQLMGNDYLDYKKAWNKADSDEKPVNDKKLYKLVRGESFPKLLIEKINEEYISSKLKPKWFDNTLLPYYLYFCVYFEQFNCPTEDFYVAYLFDKNLSKVFLTLVLGSSNSFNFDNLNFESDSDDIDETKRKFKEKIDEYKSDIYSQFNINLENYDDEIFLGRLDSNDGNPSSATINKQKEIAEKYEKGSVYVKAYDIGELPPEDELIEDFNNFIKIYYFILNKFFKDEFWGFKHNLIYFGAPGTGKSYRLNKDKDKLIKNESNYERVTFHPDYSYANFVGTYKPVPIGNDVGDNNESTDISYEYVPGPFICMLIKALKHSDEVFLLIIEEINRANVAAVFGDIFQLLDRNESNESRYPINIPIDLKKYLEKKGVSDEKLRIPSNFYIWATMNSADQGVFPMDTAFKRRWDFKYLGIDYGQEEIEKTYVFFNNKKISWNKLRKEINKQLLTEEYKINEDKLLGPFFAFIEYQNKEIPVDVFKETFQNKIIMYLFEDAARPKRNELFEGARGDLTNITYSEICEKFEKEDVGIFCETIKNSDIFVDEGTRP